MRRTEVVLDILLVTLLVLTAVVGVYQPAKAGVLVGQSMEPTITDGDLMIYEPGEEAEVGEIIIFSDVDHNNVLVAHRVVEKNATHYVTRGDNNSVRDDPIERTGSHYKGRIAYHRPVPIDIPIPQDFFVEHQIDIV